MQRVVHLGKDDFHLSSFLIFNSKNQMLIQQRQAWKEGWPNMWDITVGGSALSGETSIQAAERETHEEIGYKIDLSKERPFFTINFDVGFDDYYLVEREIEIKGLSLQYDEVQQVKWASREEILQLIEERKFIDYWFTDLLFDMRKHRGGHKPKQFAYMLNKLVWLR